MPFPSINDETEKFYFAKYGHEYAVGFRNDEGFIQRSYNFMVNNSVTNRKLRRFHEAFAYVTIDSKEKLLEGLVSQFRGEIILNKEVPLLSEKFDEETQTFSLEYDDKKIDTLAAEKAQRFLNEKVVYENFMALNAVVSTPAYTVASDI